MVNGKTIGIDARMIEMSGIGTYIQHLMGHGIYDIAVGDETTIRKYDKEVKIIPFDAKIYGSREQLLFPYKAIKSAGVRIMHFPHYNVPLNYRGEYVVTVHDLIHIILPDSLGNRIKYLYAKKMMSRTLHKATHIFTVSENSKRDIINYFGAPSDKISITYNAVDEDFRIKEKKEIEYLYGKYPISREKKIILYVGNLKPHKNLGTLLKAFQMISQEDAQLLLAGKAFKGIDLEKTEEIMGIRQYVIHTGQISKEELIDLYNLADVFVFPSLYEGFGIPPLEAMACGTPVIAANTSSIPEVVGDAAVLFDPNSPEDLAKVLEQFIYGESSEEHIEKGLVRFHTFSWENTVALIERKIAECIR